MRIYRFEEFVHEGFLSGLLKSAGSAFTGKKSKIDSILSKMRDSKMDLVKESDKIRKEIFDLHSSGKEGYFGIEMLKKSLKSYQISKNAEMQVLKKEAMEIIGDKPDLLSYFQAGLANIEKESAEETFRLAKKYETEDELKKLADDLERLSIAADKKSNHLISASELTSDADLFDPETERILSMSSGEFESHVSGLTEKELDSLEKSLKKYTWSLQKLMDNATQNLRRQLTRARKEDDVYLESSIRKEIREIEFSYRQEYKEAKEKIYKIEKISRKKYAAQENK